MRYSFSTIAIVAALPLIAIATKGSPKIPDCASRCWTNSKYVSTCIDDAKCLCEDDAFQSTVFQCLYTQCQTNHFGPALHYALSECTDFDGGGTEVLPHLIRQQGLRNRQDYDSSIASSFVSGSFSGYGSIYGSGSAMSFVTTRRPMAMSGSAYPQPTQATTFSTPPRDKDFTFGPLTTPSSPHFFPLSPTTPVITATPNPVSLDTKRPLARS